MTQRYAHLRDETLKNASNVAGGIITRAMNGKSEPNDTAAIISLELNR